MKGLGLGKRNATTPKVTKGLDLALRPKTAGRTGADRGWLAGVAAPRQPRR